MPQLSGAILMESPVVIEEPCVLDFSRPVAGLLSPAEVSTAAPEVAMGLNSTSSPLLEDRLSGITGDVAEPSCPGIAGSQPLDAAAVPDGTSGEALLDLLDEGWFTSAGWKVAGWFGSRLFGLSTITEAQDEAEEQTDDDGAAERATCGEGRERGEGSGRGLVRAGLGSPTLDFPRSSSHCLLSSPSKGNAAAPADALESPVFDQDLASAGGARRRQTASPYSSDEESVQGGNRAGRRRARAGGRRKTKRSSSAENARELWYLEAVEGEGGDKARGTGEYRRQEAAVTPLRSTFNASVGPDKAQKGQGRFMRTRSVSDYEAKGAVPSLWDTPPGAKAKQRSVTDADIEELQGFVDLGFKFPQSHISPQMTETLPALRLYQAVGSVQQKILSRRNSSISAAGAPPLEVTRAPSADSQEVECVSTGSMPGDNNHWSIVEPNDDSTDVKNNLRLWAQAVASTVRQTC